MTDDLATVGERPVRAQVEPGRIFRQIPDAPPDRGEPMEAIFADLDRVIQPGAILASNTSYLDIDEIAAATARPAEVDRRFVNWEVPLGL